MVRLGVGGEYMFEQTSGQSTLFGMGSQRTRHLLNFHSTSPASHAMFASACAGEGKAAGQA
jgi:hypothetical protein